MFPKYQGYDFVSVGGIRGLMGIASEIKVGVKRKEAERYIDHIVEVRFIGAKPVKGTMKSVDDDFLVLDPTGPIILSQITKIKDLGKVESENQEESEK